VAVAKLHAHLPIERVLSASLEESWRNEGRPALPGRAPSDLGERDTCYGTERREFSQSYERHSDVVDPLRPRLPETTKRALRGPPETPRRVHEDVIDTASISRIERERNEVRVPMLLAQWPLLVVFSAQLGTGLVPQLA
jgi:hypothetical protein